MVPDPDTLVRQSLYIPRREARRWLHVPIEQEELVADGTLGLVKAALRFDPSRGRPFPVFALMYVRGAILDTVRDRARRNATRDGQFFETVSLDETYPDSPESRYSAIDPRPGPEEMAIHLERLRLIGGLPARERHVLLRTQVDGASAEEVGAEMGVGTATVYKLGKHGKARLRRRAAS